MKKLMTTLAVAVAALLCSVFCPSCTKTESPTTPDKEEVKLNVSKLLLLQYDMQQLLLKENEEPSGWSADDFAALKQAKAALDKAISDAKEGIIKTQEEVDAAAQAAEAAIEAFKNAYVYDPVMCELYIPGAADISNYIKLGNPGDFDNLTTISVELWFKGDELMNYQRQGSIVSNFVSADGKHYGWELNTWSNSEDPDNVGPYLIRVTRSFAEGNLREPSTQFGDYTSWHHIAYTYDRNSGETVLYLDGNSVASDTWTGEPVPPAEPKQLCCMKSLTDPGNPKGVSGCVKKLRIWSIALTAAEVNEYKDKDVEGTEDGLKAAWDFIERPQTSDGIIRDKTNSYDAQILGDGIQWRPLE